MIHVPALVLAAALAAPAASTAAPPLVAATPVPDLEILHTGDVQGYLDTCGCKVNPSGGLPRRGWVANQVRTLFPQAGIVLLDAGNFSDNPTSEGEAKTRALVEGMNRLGYAAANVGERDLTAGFPGFARATVGASFPFLSANVVRKEDGKPVFAPTKVLEVPRADGSTVRVGVIGLTRANPALQKAGPDGSTLVVADPATSLEAFLPDLRAASDVVVLLAAMPESDVRAMVGGHPDIDLVLGGTGGIASPEESAEGKTAIRYTGVQGRVVGEVRVMLSAGQKIRSTVARAYQLDPGYPSDPEMAAYLERTLAALPRASLAPLDPVH
jgi:2',3'-cyclic-nucleotide 2'-phosphodiesterase (5'-nucleotidase family)